MEKKVITLYKKKFDDIRHEKNGVEFWYARELMELLEYAQWRNFEKIIEKAKVSCDNNGICVSDHFADVSKMVEIGSKAKRPLADFLPTLTIAAKNLATEMTNYNVEEKDLQGETDITVEHVDNNSSVREMLGQRGIKPENLPPSEDIKNWNVELKGRINNLLRKRESFMNKLRPDYLK